MWETLVKLLASDWPNSSCCSHLGIEPEDERFLVSPSFFFSLYLLFSLSYSNFQINKYLKTKKENMPICAKTYIPETLTNTLAVEGGTEGRKQEGNTRRHQQKSSYTHHNIMPERHTTQSSIITDYTVSIRPEGPAVLLLIQFPANPPGKSSRGQPKC